MARPSSGSAMRRAARPPRAPLPKRSTAGPRTGNERAAHGDAQTRAGIIRAAAEIYRERGYERAGMSAIARRLGMTAPALYWYFQSKEAILLAFLEHTIADLIAFVRGQVRASAPKQRLWQFMHAYALWQLQQQELSAAYERIFALGHLRNSLPEPQRRRVTSLEREFYGMCRELIAAVQRKRTAPATVAPVAFAMIGMVEHLISWYRSSGPLSVQRIAALYADLAVAMVLAEPLAQRQTRSSQP